MSWDCRYPEYLVKTHKVNSSSRAPSWDSNPRISCWEVTVLITAPLCHLNYNMEISRKQTTMCNMSLNLEHFERRCNAVRPNFIFSLQWSEKHNFLSLCRSFSNFIKEIFAFLHVLMLTPHCQQENPRLAGFNLFFLSCH